MNDPDLALSKACEFQGLLALPSDPNVLLLAPLPKFWTQFQKAKDSSDGQTHPMDRYSKRVIGQIAREFGLLTAYPSDGPPYPDFVTWASQAPEIHQSPIGMFVHDGLGLWLSFRGALIGQHHIPLNSTKSPCLSCEQPCMGACPVDAFQPDGYDVTACRQYLGHDDAPCWTGCLARRACPAAKISRDLQQSCFHMRAFCPKD